MRNALLIVSGIVLISCAVSRAGTLTVASDGSGAYKTVQEAIAAAPAGATERTVIHIKPGTYQGPIIVPKHKSKLTFEGEDAATTILTWDHNQNEPAPPGSDKTNPGVQVIADDFRAEKITFQNTSGDHGQALALRVDGDREVFKNCRMLGWQDTLMINKGRDYFKDCYIAGRVDFIYGSATAVFDHCEIHSRNGGHVTAANTPQDQPYGYVFLNSKLTGDAIAWDPASTNPATTQKARVTPMADLGRPWRPYAAVAYINCEMGDHIKPAGWDNWRSAANEKTARYSEYNSTGLGANPDKRVPWAKQLSKQEAEQYTIKNVLGGKDNWQPED